MNKLSKNLTWKELRCKDGTEYPDKWRTNRAIQLAEVFEFIRAKCGNFPIEILSAYRSEEHNKKIGGARFSQHCNGRALDLKHSVLTNEEFYNIIKENAKLIGIGGLGKYKTFVHIDTRPSDRLITWNGSGLKDS